VRNASRAFTGLEIFRAEHVDLVLCDYYLPDFHRDELCRMMKRVKTSVPLVIISTIIPEHVTTAPISSRSKLQTR
jgi:DNA-binding response OmpR family regulator